MLGEKSIVLEIIRQKDMAKRMLKKINMLQRFLRVVTIRDMVDTTGTHSSDRIVWGG